MSEVTIEKQPELDLLDLKEPAMSAVSDMPKVETKPDAALPKPEAEAKPEPKEGDKTPEKSAAPEQPELDPTAEAEPEKKPAKGVQKRIDELVKQREEAERRAEAERAEKARLLSLLEEKSKPTAEPAKPAPDEDPEPKEPSRADFQSPEEYDAAVRKWSREYATWTSDRAVKEALADRDKQEQQKQIEEGQRAAREAYVARVEKATAKYPDYKQVAESPDVSVSIPMAQAIMHSEHGPDIAYHLGKHPEEAKRISGLNPVQQLVELGQIVAKLNAPAPETKPEPKPETKPVSAAPKPIKPLGPGASEIRKSPEEMTMEEYADYVNKRDKEARRPGARP